MTVRGADRARGATSVERPAMPGPDAGPVGLVLAKLGGAAHVEPVGDAWFANCPAHEDAAGLLSVREGKDGRAVLACGNGCALEEILSKLGLTVADLYPPPPPEPPRTRWRLDELWADEVVMRPPPPVVPRLVWGGRSTLLASYEKLGKSTLTGYLIACVSRGRPFLDEPCDRGVVLLVGLEEYIGDPARRLRGFDADGERVYVVDRLPAEPRQRVRALRAHVEAVKPTLVVIDTLIAYGDGLVTESGSSAQMGPLVNGITAVAHDSGAGLVLNHHARKEDGRYRDSTAIGAAVDVIAEMFAPEDAGDPSLRKFRVRGRVPTHDFAVRFDGADYRLASGPTAPLDARLVEFIRANAGASLRAVRQAMGGRAQDVDDALTRLVAAGRVVDEGGAGHRSFSVVPYTQHSRQHDARVISATGLNGIDGGRGPGRLNGTDPTTDPAQPAVVGRPGTLPRPLDPPEDACPDPCPDRVPPEFWSDDRPRNARGKNGS